MKQIVECVPNFSNGRSPKIYNSIADEIRSVQDVHVLDVSADPDHNRTVITFVGTLEAVEEAAFRAIAKAAQLIDLDKHQGEHPRLGATDVCPFIPVHNVTMKECVAAAKRVGQRVGKELGIAVYLYGKAATQPNREKLSVIRKGEYELWKTEVATNPKREPDFGPAEPKRWGATVIGARPFLIAYNIYLNSDDAALADKIAKSVRFIGGGLRFVQAKGFLVEGQAQVSMNLTNFNKTSMYHVQEMVRREAARYGLTITHAELVGLIPQKALLETAKWYLQIDELDDKQILEFQLQEKQQETASDSLPLQFLDDTAAAQATPGGGSVAALAGALGAALTQMVAGLTLNKKKYANVQDKTDAIRVESIRLRKQLTAAVAEDAAAFDQVMAAYRNKGLDKAERAQAIESATIGAGEVPLRVARLSRDVAILAQEIGAIGNVNAVTDAAAAAYMALAAVQAASLNVRVNGAGLADQELAKAWQGEVATLIEETTKIAERVAATASERGGF
ncbi:MAG: glutamate formimidoyltransferase [Chloroflexi bacterium]|nr:MAG: glutamate formimidoyltransferase [Chloroflexota bacterium]